MQSSEILDCITDEINKTYCRLYLQIIVETSSFIISSKSVNVMIFCSDYLSLNNLWLAFNFMMV